MGTLEQVLGKVMQVPGVRKHTYIPIYTRLHNDLIFYKWCSVRLPNPTGEVSRVSRQPQVWECRPGRLEESCSGRQVPLSYSHISQGAMSRAGGRRTSPMDSGVLSPPGWKQHPQGKEVNPQHPPLLRSLPSPLRAFLCPHR